MDWWRRDRFGQFLSWGPVTLTGKEIGWTRGGERRDGYESGSIPVEIYDNLYKHFNPSLFNAEEWVRVAKDGGAKYIIFLTKHHDGFCLWDTKTTEYKITNSESPFRRDVAREIADACHKAGMKLIWYFSLGDWHHPDYYTENHSRFDEAMLDQIRELCTNYGKIDGFWFDLAYAKMHENDMAEKISNLIHNLQPGAIINNRGGLSGDYDTPEQRIGAFQVHRPWESCITLGTQWAWKPQDNIKSFEDCIEILTTTAGGDGNLALDIGPMPDGRIEPRQADRMREIGKWLHEYGESIYGTRGGPFMPGDYGSSTYKDNKIYLHVLNWEGESISLPPMGAEIVGSYLMTGGDLNVVQTPDEITVSVSKQDQKQPDTVVVLELDAPASDVLPVITGLGSRAFRRKSTASSVHPETALHGPDKAFDGDNNTHWISEEIDGQAWLEVDLGKNYTIAQAVVYEAHPGRIKQFQIQYKTEEAGWKTAYSGVGLGAQAVVRFIPVEARMFRLHIHKADGRPSIAEFKLMEKMIDSNEEYKTSASGVSEETWSAALEDWVKVGASSVYDNSRQYGPDKLFDGQRWIPGNVKTAWLDVDFGTRRTVNEAVITTNRYWKSVEKFELQRLIEDEWQSFYSNNELNKTSGTVKLTFEPVSLSQLRMKITMGGNSDYIEAYQLLLSNTSETK